jgi:D-alanyl-D-alanine carboxypeptidase/D-alanyl-D-alanine-endopeptidase (penicillin-binding protein 4)
MVLSPVVVNDNVVDVAAQPGAAPGAPAVLRASPDTGYLRLVNRVTTAPADGKGGDLTVAADVVAADGTRTVTVAGSVPLGGASARLPYGVPDPDRFAAYAFAEALSDAGVGARPAPRDEAADFKALASGYTPERLLAEHVSAPLTEEVKIILKVSQNLHASLMPYVLGAGSDTPRDTGFARMREAFTGAGLDLAGASQGDGAGATAHFTPRFMVRFLAWAARQPWGPAFAAGLPILGRDGTLFDVQTGSPAAGSVQAKTGTYVEEDPLNGALFVNGKGLAGYVRTRDGRRLAFCAYANHVPVSRAPDAVRDVVGQALGEIAAAAYDALP